MTQAAVTALSACAAIELVWEELDDLMGSAATATLLGRAARRAARRAPEIGELLIKRERFKYQLTCPPSWKLEAAHNTLALLELIRELEPLLLELTGPVVLKRLHAVASLSGLFGAKSRED